MPQANGRSSTANPTRRLWPSPWRKPSPSTSAWWCWETLALARPHSCATLPCATRDRAEGTTVVRDRLGLPESGSLPILLPLRNLGAYLKSHHATDDGTEGHQRLLAFLA